MAFSSHQTAISRGGPGGREPPRGDPMVVFYVSRTGRLFYRICQRPWLLLHDDHESAAEAAEGELLGRDRVLDHGGAPGCSVAKWTLIAPGGPYSAGSCSSANDCG